MHLLVDAPLATGRFVRAIAESGLPPMALPTLAAAERDGVAFARRLGAKSLAQLREVPADELLDAANTATALRFSPVADGQLVRGSAAGARARGQNDDARGEGDDVPMIVGRNADDESSSAGVGARAAARNQTARDQGLALLRAWSLERIKHSRSPLYAYIFTHVEPGQRSAQFGAFHSSEIPYVFTTLDAAPERHFSMQDRIISRMVSTYWVNFIRRGDPNEPALPTWAPVTTEQPAVMELGDEPQRRPLGPRAGL